MHATGFHYVSNPVGDHHLGRLVLVVALTAALIIPSSLVAAKQPGAQPGAAETGNNLSVPTYFVPNGESWPFGGACPSAPKAPQPPPDDYFEPPDAAAGRYYVQGLSTWQAECRTSTAARGVTAVWGDNLVNGRPFQPNRQIRIEMKLRTNRYGTGYPVVKLEDTLDRLAKYGTKGVPESMSFMVWGPGQQDNLVICADKACDSQVDGRFHMGEEINSTGQVVYGYSWRAPAGEYWLRFNAPVGVEIGGVNGGDDTAYRPAYVLVKIVVGRDGGGGGKPGGGGKH